MGDSRATIIAAFVHLVWSLGALAADAPSVPVPIITPGYHPVQARDERGIWLELEDYEKAVARSPLRVRESALNEYVEEMVCRIANDYCGDFRVYVVRNPYFNASMAANGMMQVWTGLLTRTETESELATVIGHEIAHYQLAHTLAQFRKIRKGMAVGSFFDVGLALVGVPIPLGQLTVILDALAFSRREEEEADLLGAKLMASVGYDPHATYRVWRGLIEEDRRAEIKRDEPGLFSKTHPEPDARAEVLEAWVAANYGGESTEPRPREEFRALLADNIEWMMADQIKTSRYGRTEYLLERQAAIGMPPGAVHYFRAEMLQQRAAEGDVEQARIEYEQAIASDRPPPEAYRNLGYLLVKQGERTAARVHFERYLSLAPGADDRAMVEFYLEAAR
jgi:predicted Zn-dependent protease